MGLTNTSGPLSKAHGAGGGKGVERHTRKSWKHDSRSKARKRK